MQFLRLSYLAFFGFIVLGVTAMPKPTPGMCLPFPMQDFSQIFVAPVVVDLGS